MTEKQIYKALMCINIDAVMLKNAERCWDAICAYLAKHLEKELNKQKNPNQWHPNAGSVLDTLNTLCGRNFRDTASNLGIISARLNEKGVTIEGVNKMIHRQVARWKGTDMEEYLRPSTLFRASKFDAYYANRDLPVNNAPRKRIPLMGENY